jgi:hypothetical protein
MDALNRPAGKHLRNEAGSHVRRPNRATRATPEPTRRQVDVCGAETRVRLLVRVNQPSDRFSVMWPHLTAWATLLPAIGLGLRTLWFVPDWLLKVVAVAEAVQRYRRQRDDDPH